MTDEAEIWFCAKRILFFLFLWPVHWKGFAIIFLCPILLLVVMAAAGKIFPGHQDLFLIPFALTAFWLVTVVNRHTEYL